MKEPDSCFSVNRPDVNNLTFAASVVDSRAFFNCLCVTILGLLYHVKSYKSYGNIKDISDILKAKTEFPE